MHIPIGLQTVALAVGMLYLLMALTVWVMLMRRHPQLPLALWSVGSLCAGAGLVLIGMQGASPSRMDYLLAGGFMQWSFFLRVGALRLDLGLPLRAARGAVLAAVLLAVYHASNRVPDEALRLTVGTVILVAGTAALAWYAREAGGRIPSRSGTVLAWAEASAAAGLLIRMFSALSGVAEAAPVMQLLQFVVLLLLGSAAVVYSSLGYLGMAMDRLSASEGRAQAEKLEAQRGRDRAVEQAEALRNLLGQRDRLSAERESLLQLLAHEIRQPLHNASGALQTVRQLLAAQAAARLQGDVLQVPSVMAPLLRAQGLLGDLHSVLDNTLAASGFFTRSVPLALQEVEVDFLLRLALGDLSSVQQAQVLIEKATDLRSIEVEPGLVRLALRNLLRNAFRHGGPQVTVTLRASEREAPAALVLEVLDDGVGAELSSLQFAAPTLAERGQGRVVRGLGLTIVREVAALHGGALEMAPRLPRGLVFSLVLPLPGPDAAPAAGPLQPGLTTA